MIKPIRNRHLDKHPGVKIRYSKEASFSKHPGVKIKYPKEATCRAEPACNASNFTTYYQ